MKCLERSFKNCLDIKQYIHFLKLIVAPDRVANLHEYYTENISKSLDLFKNLNELGCKNVVFPLLVSVYAIVHDIRRVVLRFWNAQIPLRYSNLIRANLKLRSGEYI